MKTLIGAVLCILGILLGLYIGFWIMLVGGIVQVIEQIRAENLEVLSVAIGVARILLASLAGWLAVFALFIPGCVLICSDN